MGRGGAAGEESVFALLFLFMPFFGSILPTPLTRGVAQTYNEAVPCEGARHAARAVNPYGQGVKIRENVGESFKLSCGTILSLRKFLFPQGAHSHHCVPERIDPINLFCSLCRRGFGLQQVPRNKTIGFNIAPRGTNLCRGIGGAAFPRL